MNQFENHLGIFKWRSECIFVFFVLNHWSHCIRIMLMLMYNIASWIAENHNKLPKINSKHCCYLPFKAVDSWPWYEVGQTTKQCTNTHTWHITYLYRRCLLKSTANFFFVTVRFWTVDVRWPSFTVDVADPILWSACMYSAAIQVFIILEKKIFISTIADPNHAIHLTVPSIRLDQCPIQWRCLNGTTFIRCRW